MRTHRFIVSEVPTRANDLIELDDLETHHALNVLRLETGTLCEALDGQSSSVACTFERQKKRAFLRPIWPLQIRKPAPHETLDIILEVACLKSDAMQWSIEKAVELGAKAWVPIHSEYTLGKPNPKWQHWADQALKQSGRIQRMQILESRSLDRLDHSPRFWLDEMANPELHLFAALKTKLPQPLRLLVGPEGGWSMRDRREIQLAGGNTETSAFSLGPNILRAETAVISALSICAAVLRSA